MAKEGVVRANHLAPFSLIPCPPGSDPTRTLLRVSQWPCPGEEGHMKSLEDALPLHGLLEDKSSFRTPRTSSFWM